MDSEADLGDFQNSPEGHFDYGADPDSFCLCFILYRPFFSYYDLHITLCHLLVHFTVFFFKIRERINFSTNIIA